MSNMETYYGHVKTPQDAIILFEACRLGILPRVQRRLSEKERQQIRSGSVFVWDEREAGMRRWTDGKSWSASRVSGSFLTYREMEGKRGGNGYAGGNGKKSGSKGVDSKDSDQDGGEDGPDGYRYKPDGLMKQSFSITTSDGRHLHLISYYARPPANCQPLKQPTTDPLLRNVHPQKGMYPEATVNEAANIPAVTRGPMGGGPYPQAAPPVAQPYPYPPPPNGYMPYPPASWPASPAHTPPAYYAPYPPHPAYAVAYPPAPYAHPHHIPPQYAPPPGPTQFDRPPPPPAQTALPPPQSLPNGHHPPPAYAPITSPRAHSLPPYAQNGPTSTLQPNPYGTNSLEPPRTPHNPPYSSPAATTSAPNGYHQQKPPTPPPSSNGVTPSEKIPELAQPPPPLTQPPHTFSHAQTNGTHHETPTAPPQPPQSTTPPRMLPAIHAMLNNDQTELVDNRSDKSGSRAGSRSPANGAALGTPATSAPRPALARDIPEMMAAGGAGFQKGQTDLDKLKTRFLK